MPGKQRSVLFILGALTAFGPMSIDMYLPSLPTLERDFGATAAQVQLTLSAFFVGLAVGQAVYGPLADRFGRKPPIYVGLSIYLLATAGCALAPDVETLIWMRFIQAVGGCVGIVIARAVVRDLFEHQDSARVLSALMLVVGVAPILAPLVGGWILVLTGWRAIFWALGIFGLACLVAAVGKLPETRPANSVRPGFGSAIADYARLIVDRRFIGYALAGGVAQAGLFAYISGSPFVFIDVYGVPAHAYGWLFGINAVGLIGAAQINRRLLARLKADVIFARANAVNAAFGVALVAVAASGIGGLIGLSLPLFGYVASLGFTFPNSAAGAMSHFPERAGSASALFGTLQFTLAAIAGTSVGHLHDGTALPMAAVISFCGVLAFASHRILVARPAAAHA